jgi:AbrB family transcriptional regulator (stage V sporulation protein T)
MKATGIVRRIDDLGRVVIPKEIRRTLRIKEGDPLEIFTDREGEVIFKKYSPIGELQSFATEYADTLQKTSSMPIFICDRDAIIAVSGASKKEYLERKISKGLEDIVESRALYIREEGNEVVALTHDGGSHYVNCAMPILSEGDVVGCVLSALSYNESAKPKISGETESKLIQTAGIFLGKQMEG